MATGRVRRGILPVVVSSVVWLAAFTEIRLQLDPAKVLAAALLEVKLCFWAGSVGFLLTGSLGMLPEPSVNMETSLRACTADELLPLEVSEGVSRSSEWVDSFDPEPLYGCDCSFYKARYFCPSIYGFDRGYPKWVPHHVAAGQCESLSQSELAEAPLPPNFKVLMYGNSHMRQVAEAIMCNFSNKVVAKHMTYREPGNIVDRWIHGDTQCRACMGLNQEQMDFGCLHQDVVHDACRCDDDHAEYLFENGAIVHYYYAGIEPNKSMKDALVRHGNVSLSYYDAVFANNGNGPIMTVDATCEAAFELQVLSVPFFWLSTYGGQGSVNMWNDAQKAQFTQSGARFVNVGQMLFGLSNFSRGVVEDVVDTHFCLPGPPDELGFLLLKILWAGYQEGGAAA